MRENAVIMPPAVLSKLLNEACELVKDALRADFNRETEAWVDRVNRVDVCELMKVHAWAKDKYENSYLLWATDMGDVMGVLHRGSSVDFFKVRFF